MTEDDDQERQARVETARQARWAKHGPAAGGDVQRRVLSVWPAHMAINVVRPSLHGFHEPRSQHYLSNIADQLESPRLDTDEGRHAFERLMANYADRFRVALLTELARHGVVGREVAHPEGAVAVEIFGFKYERHGELHALGRVVDAAQVAAVDEWVAYLAGIGCVEASALEDTKRAALNGSVYGEITIAEEPGVPSRARRNGRLKTGRQQPWDTIAVYRNSDTGALEVDPWHSERVHIHEWTDLPDPGSGGTATGQLVPDVGIVPEAVTPQITTRSGRVITPEVDSAVGSLR